MDHGALELEDVYDAVRLLRHQEERAANGEAVDDALVDELKQYIEVMTPIGFGEPDEIQVLPFAQDAEGSGVERVTATWPTPSALWRAIRRNINKGGVLLTTDQIMPIDTTFDFEGIVLHPAVRFNVRAKVIWANPPGRAGRPAGIGLKFIWASPADQSLFRSFVAGDAEVIELGALGAPEPEP